MDYLDCHESIAWIKTKTLQQMLSFANEKFSMETFIGQIIPVFTEKYEFDYRDKSLFLNKI